MGNIYLSIYLYIDCYTLYVPGFCRGGTNRFFKHAEKSTVLLGAEGATSKTVTIEGPYGRMRPLRQFDSVVLFAGSTGATFTMPLLRDIVFGWREGNAAGTLLQPGGVVTRHVRFVWVVKTRKQFEWFAAQLEDVSTAVTMLQAEGRQVDVEISIYCTCDESFTDEHKSAKKSTAHGNVEEVDNSTSRPSLDNEKKTASSSRESVHELLSQHSGAHACGGGTCCCKSTIEDEAEESKSPRTCCCSSATSEAKTLT